MKAIYKRHKIVQTNTQLANDGRYLFAIEGRFAKDAGRRPFLASIRQAQAWINDQIEGEREAAKWDADDGPCGDGEREERQNDAWATRMGYTD